MCYFSYFSPSLLFLSVFEGFLMLSYHGFTLSWTRPSQEVSARLLTEQSQDPLVNAKRVEGLDLVPTNLLR